MRHSTRRLPVLFSLAFLVLASVAAAQSPVSTSLTFKPQEGVGSDVPLFPEGFTEKSATLKLVDARTAKDPTTIGEGTDRKDRPFPIQTSDDVKGYASDVLSRVAEQWGVKSGKDRQLTVKLSRFFVTESRKAVGSMYSGDVTIHYTLADGRGRTLKSGTVQGDTKRYGRAQSRENYNEVLSDALKDAYYNMFNDEDLKEAWVSGKAKK
ncbi:MAG TPA: hypothetical protein VNA04_03195 [Thermoanaerobaculia bacterium]|nr:hypothetical protein [Thermoanaerobaculia bacterium]